MFTISNYHYIRENFNANYPSIFGVTPDLFKKQLILLKGKGDFISSNDLILNGDEILKSKDNYYLITFDDGLKEQYNYALPVLEELNIPVILFANSRNYQDKKVSTVHKIHLLRSILSPKEFLSKISHQNDLNTISDANVEKAQSIYIYDDKETAVLKYLLNFKMDFTIQEKIIKVIFDNYFNENELLNELYMSDKEIVHLSEKGFLGSHTHNHFPIGLMNEDEIIFELENSKLYFEKLTNTKIETVAYPYGSPEASTSEVARIAKKVGYKYGFTTTRGINTQDSNCLLLNRFDCNDMPGGKNYKVV